MTLDQQIAAAEVTYFQHKAGKDGIVGNPRPMLAEVLAPGWALAESYRRDAERYRALFKMDGWEIAQWLDNGMQELHFDKTRADERIDAALSANGAGVE